jgi:hypothetical protein
VKRGAVNIGEISAELQPAGDALAFTMGTDETLAFDKGDEYDCRVRLRRLVDYLLITDNGNCGGMNVRFDGVYRRVKS